MPATTVSNFGADVNSAIDLGLAYLNSNGAFSGYPSCTSAGYYGRQVRGLPLLALLEKRVSSDINSEPQGYKNASADDQTRMRKAVSCILQDIQSDSYYTQAVRVYTYGNWLMGLSLYARTGGPGKGSTAEIPNDAALIDLAPAIDKMTDTLLTLQGSSTNGCASSTCLGMWGYAEPGDDSSTTQFAAAGLSAAKAYYKAVGDAGARISKITTALSATRKAYATNAGTGSDNGACSVIEATEKGFGYHPSYSPSLQQTASGLWVQTLGGAGPNDAGVQAFLRWVRNHYRWQDLDDMGNYWASSSYWYYMWSAMKGLIAIQDMVNAGTAITAGNLGADAYGKLAPDADPDSTDAYAGTCPVRQVNKDPATVARNTIFGADPGNYYKDEAKSTYFDFASDILSHQCANGNFACNTAPSSWDNAWDRMGWALLVLLRSSGGVDQPAPEGGLLCDSNSDGKVTMADVNAIYALRGQKVTSANAWANYASTGSSAGIIDINDFWQCYYVGRGMLPLKYY
ncbi:MAG: hypothetical protein FIB04_04845 [Gammaproteobacteria bacterium]|nr:hypothetical protein [Gammaproteobacteria bacterium]